MSGMSNYFTGIVADASGNFFVTKQGGYNSIIQKFSSVGSYINEVQIPDGSECLYIASDGNNIFAIHSGGIIKYSNSLVSSASIVKYWTSKGALVIGDYLYILYTDLTYQYQISKFDLNLNLISTAVISGSSGNGIGSYGSLIYLYCSGAVCSISITFSDGETLTPTSIFSVSCSYFTVGLSGNFIVSSDTIYIYSPVGALIQTFPSGAGDGEFSSPVGIFVK